MNSSAAVRHRSVSDLNRIARAAIAILLLSVVAACGSSATSVTAPSTISRCSIAIQLADSQIPAAGGSGSVAVTAARDCTWSATSEAQWLSIRSTATGQGDGAVEFSAAMNPDPAVRRGAIVLNGQRAEITQAAGSCEITLGQSSVGLGQAGGSGTIPVRASSAMCTWTASSDEDWVSVRPANGSGNGQVTFEVPPTTGPPRTAIISIANQKFSVTQAEGCGYTISPISQIATPAGGTGAISIATAQGCPWTASSNAEWLTVGRPSGSGPGSVPITVAPTGGPARTGTAIVAGQTFTVVQSQGCSYAVQPTSHTEDAGGGTVTVSVQAGAGCTWSASTDAEWITLSGTRSGVGNGTVPLTIAATTGPARSGAVTIAGQRVSVTQSAGCTFSIAPESASVPSAGGTGRISVSAASGCAWTATSSAQWLTITSGASGSGNGEVQYSAAASSGPGRTAAMTIAGKTFTLTQGTGCSFALSSNGMTIDDDGGSGSFTVQAAAGCGWTAESTASWIVLTQPASGSGAGQVRFTVAVNAGPSRSGAITAGGQTFTVQQGTGCSYSLSATTHNVSAAGGSGSVDVSAGGGCAWTATSNASWLSVTSGASGTGGGTVGFAAVANTGSARSATLTVAGRTFTVSQAESCAYAIAPEQAPIAAAGGSLDVTVTSSAGCAWSSSSNASWIRINPPGSGSGSGTVRLTIDPHAGAPRTGTATIAGRQITITQGSGCSYSIAPSAQTVPAAGATVVVSLSTSDSCGWNVVSQAAWLSLQSDAAGTGNHSVRIAVSPNTGPLRTGVVDIAGQTLTVTQESGCSYVVAPENVSIAAAGGTSRIDVAAAASCTWTASSGAGWINVTSGASGTATGAVELAIAANSGPARSGALSIAGRGVTVSQESGCTFGLSVAAQPMGAGGGNGFVNVTAGDGCTWTATSNAPWITVTGGASGTGGGSVQFTVAANATGAPRSGTITVAGLTFTINQE